MQILGWIVFGAFIGWLASLVMGRRGSGCLVNIALGLGGAVVGGSVFSFLGPGFDYDQHNFLVSTIVALIGAVIVLAIGNAVMRR